MILTLQNLSIIRYSPLLLSKRRCRVHVSVSKPLFEIGFLVFKEATRSRHAGQPLANRYTSLSNGIQIVVGRIPGRPKDCVQGRKSRHGMWPVCRRSAVQDVWKCHQANLIRNSSLPCIQRKLSLQFGHTTLLPFGMLSQPLASTCPCMCWVHSRVTERHWIWRFGPWKNLWRTHSLGHTL